MSQTKDTNTISGQRYVKAIIGYLKEKGRSSVSFDKSTYEDWNDIPFCNALQETIDTVSISNEKPGCITVSVCREDGFMAYEVFDGSEKDEDFDYLFHEVYYYINDFDADEAEVWMEQFENKFSCPLSEWLIDRIIEIAHLFHKGIKVPATWWNDMGMEYDTLSVLDINGKEVVGLVDSANGENNPTYQTLNKLTASELLQNYKFLLIKEAENIIEDYDWSKSKEEWAEDAVCSMIKFKTITNITERIASANFIYETMRWLKEGGINNWKLNEDLSFESPYVIIHDGFLALSQEDILPFLSLQINDGNESYTDDNGTMHAENNGTTIEVRIKDIFDKTDDMLIMCRPESVVINTKEVKTTLTDESVKNLEKMCQYIVEDITDHESVREVLSSVLIDTNENNQIGCNVSLVYKNGTRTIDRVYQIPGEGTIWAHIKGLENNDNGYVNTDELSTHVLSEIVYQLKQQAE